MLQNEEASVKYCQAILDKLSKALMENISAGIYSVPGGHELYKEAKNKVEWNYNLVLRKGVKVKSKEGGVVARTTVRGCLLHLLKIYNNSSIFGESRA